MIIANHAHVKEDVSLIEESFLITREMRMPKINSSIDLEGLKRHTFTCNYHHMIWEGCLIVKNNDDRKEEVRIGEQWVSL